MRPTVAATTLVADPRRPRPGGAHGVLGTGPSIDTRFNGSAASTTSQAGEASMNANGSLRPLAWNGTIVVLKNTPPFDLLAKNDVGEAVIGTPAIADGRLFIRTRNKLFCVGQ